MAVMEPSATFHVFAIQFGGYPRLANGFGGFIERLILPSVTLATVYVALIACITRGSDRLNPKLRQI